MIRDHHLKMMLLVKSQMLEKPISIHELMTYCLSPVAHCLATPDGFFAKTNKATMLHQVLKEYHHDPVMNYPPDAFHIIDGNAVYHALKAIPPTFAEIALQILDMHVPKKNFLFSTDSYHKDSPKTLERIRRGVSEPYVIGGPATRRPKDFSVFLGNDDNKMQMTNITGEVWGSLQALSRLKKVDNANLVVDGKMFNFKVIDGKVSSNIHCMVS